MNRNRKLIKNSCIIFVILFIIYYFGGFYFSQEKCIIDSNKALHAKETEIIMQFENNNHYRTLMTDKDKSVMGLVGTQKIGFLYTTDSGSHGQVIDKDNSIDITGSYSRELGFIIVVYRNISTVSKVVVELEDGSEFVLSEWKDNFSGILLDKDDWLNGIYKVYNANNELIEEIEY